MFIIPSKEPKSSVIVRYVYHVRMLQDTEKFTATSLTRYIILFLGSGTIQDITFEKNLGE